MIDCLLHQYHIISAECLHNMDKVARAIGLIRKMKAIVGVASQTQEILVMLKANVTYSR